MCCNIIWYLYQTNIYTYYTCGWYEESLFMACSSLCSTLAASSVTRCSSIKSFSCSRRPQSVAMCPRRLVETDWVYSVHSNLINFFLKIWTCLLWVICMDTGLLPCIVLILNTDRNQVRLNWNGLEWINMKCKSAGDYLHAVAWTCTSLFSTFGHTINKFNFAVAVPENHIYVRFMPLTQTWAACPRSFIHFLKRYQFTSYWSCRLRLVCLRGKRFWLPNTKGNPWVQRARSRSSRALAQHQVAGQDG